MSKQNGSDQGKISAIILSNNDSHRERDVLTLKRFGIHVAAVCTSGTEAFQELMGSSRNLVLCDSQLEDMDAKTFLRTVKNNPRLKKVPVVMCTSDNSRNSVLDAVSLGCSGYILRPYSLETFESHINTALQLTRYSEIEVQQINDAKSMLEEGRYDEAIAEFEELISSQEEAEKYYELGCKYLMRFKYGKAIVSFQKAIRINDLYAEAYQGLAEAYRGKGDMGMSKTYLKRAANVYAEFDRMEKVKELFVDILKMDHTATNPYNTLGVKLRKKGDYDGALRAYTQALELTPTDENIYFNMAKAYYFSGRPEQALERVIVALGLKSDFPEAKLLYREIRGVDYRESDISPSGDGTYAPLLKDI